MKVAASTRIRKAGEVQFSRFRSPVVEATMTKRICSFDPCGREAHSKGLCAAHYSQQARGRPLSPIREQIRSSEGCQLCGGPYLAKGLCSKCYQRATYKPRYRPSLREKIEARLDTTGECWLWMGAKDTGGYGLIGHQGRKCLKVHRAYLAAIGLPVPEGMTVDHLCRVHACCNPDHLEVVTHRENVLRGVGPTAANAAKTHCIRGHEFTPENTYSPPTRPHHRQCRECIRIRCRQRRAEQKGI